MTVTPYPDPITIDGVKSKLAGLDPWLDVARNSGANYDDSVIADVIPARTRHFEREMEFRVNPIQVVSYPDGLYNGLDSDGNPTGYDVTGVYEVFEEPAHDYYMDDSWEYMKVWLTQRPVQMVQRVRLMLGPTSSIYQVPSDWFRIDRRSGRFTIQPVSGSLTVVGSAIALGTVMAGFNANYTPQIIAFDYMAGLPLGWAANGTREWADLKRALENWCAAGVLEDICEAFDAGKSSKSISDGMGLQQSAAYTRFQGRIAQLEASSARLMKTYREQERPVEMVIV